MTTTLIHPFFIFIASDDRDNAVPYLIRMAKPIVDSVTAGLGVPGLGLASDTGKGGENKKTGIDDHLE
jgi:hypothetical protein